MLGLNSESGLGLELGCIQYIKLLIQYIKLLIQYIKLLIQYTIGFGGHMGEEFRILLIGLFSRKILYQKLP